MRHPWSVLLVAAPLVAQPPAPAPDPFSPLRFLLGSWVPDGACRPGQPTGAATFSLELGGHVMLRRSHAETAGGRHEDRLSIYPEGQRLRAIYLDNEGHVIHYTVTGTAEGAVFLSDPGPGPRFRLSYHRTGTDTVSLVFEIAPPGKPEAFATYLQAATRRKS